jgi:cell division protein FtsW (lipid II flippase)
MTSLLIYLCVALGVVAAGLVVYYAVRWQQARKKAKGPRSLAERVGVAFGASAASTSVWALPLTIFGGFWLSGVVLVFLLVLALVVVALSDDAVPAS